jgi:hypothetical protein
MSNKVVPISCIEYVAILAAPTAEAKRVRAYVTAAAARGQTLTVTRMRKVVATWRRADLASKPVALDDDDVTPPGITRDEFHHIMLTPTWEAKRVNAYYASRRGMDEDEATDAEMYGIVGEWRRQDSASPIDPDHLAFMQAVYGREEEPIDAALAAILAPPAQPSQSNGAKPVATVSVGELNTMMDIGTWEGKRLSRHLRRLSARGESNLTMAGMCEYVSKRRRMDQEHVPVVDLDDPVPAAILKLRARGLQAHFRTMEASGSDSETWPSSSSQVY